MNRLLRSTLVLVPTLVVIGASGAGCSLRGAGPSDLVGGGQTRGQGETPYQGEPADGDPRSVTAGSDGYKRQYEVIGTCEVPEPKVTKLLPVPKGEFLMGCNTAIDQTCRPNENPSRVVYLDAFEIDETEVTQAQYYQCVKAGECRAPVCWDPCNKGNHPVGCVNRDDAADYCKWVGKRLPTEAEWEKAARGTDGLLYPWGNDAPSCTRGNIAGCKDKNDTAPVGSFPEGASPYGALDMVGNVVELVADWYDPDYYTKSPPDENPKGPATGEDYVGKGGSAWSLPQFQRTSTRDDYDPHYFKWGLGFRCAR
jgi:formylglycine-generating enzyme required for sulfatase activity